MINENDLALANSLKKRRDELRYKAADIRASSHIQIYNAAFSGSETKEGFTLEAELSRACFEDLRELIVNAIEAEADNIEQEMAALGVAIPGEVIEKKEPSDD